jgi:hypothetical protein
MTYLYQAQYTTPFLPNMASTWLVGNMSIPDSTINDFTVPLKEFASTT